MKGKLALVGLLIVVGGMVVLLWGCPSPVVMVRPPEPRTEVYGPAPSPQAIWIPGYWKYSGGEWIWIPGYWKRPPRPNAVWVPGHWEPRGPGWAWIPGHWGYR